MGISALGAAAITAGSQLLGSGTNAYFQGKMNKKSREWNEQQYWRTRGDSLRDWAMQNEYNSPQAQMQRFRDAGLNPNLIYGQTNTAEAVRSSETPAWNPRAPQVDLSANSTLSRYYDTKLQEANINYLLEQSKTQQQQQANIAADTALKGQNFEAGSWAAANAAEIGKTSLQASQALLRKTDVETQISLNQDQRNAALTSQSLQEGLKRIAKIDIENAKTQADIRNSQQMLKNLENDNEIKKLDIQLKRQGLQPTDPAWMRIITQQWEKLKKSIPDVKFKNMDWENFKKGWNDSRNR